MARYPTIILVCLLLLVASCSGGTSGGGGVKIGGVRYGAGGLQIEIDAAVAAPSSKIDVISSQGNILCSAYKDLAIGTNHLELADCPVEERIKVSVSPPGGAMAVKEVSLDLPIPKVSIGEVRPGSDSILVGLDSTLPAEKVRVDVVLGSDVMCTKYLSLVKGSNTLTLDSCEIGAILNRKVTIAVQPEGGALVTKEVTFTAPRLELREGYRYDYTIASSSWGQLDISVYSTKVSSSAWEGILGLKNVNSKNAALLRFQVPKDGLGLRTTSTLSFGQIDEPPTYKSITDVSLGSEVTNAIMPLLIPYWAADGLDVAELMEEKSTSFTGKGTSSVMNAAIDETTVEGGNAVHKISFFPDAQQPILLTVSASAPHLVVGATLPGLGPIEYLGETKGSFKAGDYASYSIQEEQIAQLQSQEPTQEPSQPVNREQTS